MNTIPRATHCVLCAKPAAVTPLRTTRASATRRSTRPCLNSRPTYISTFILKTISCSRERLRWNRRSNRLETVSGIRATQSQRPRRDNLPPSEFGEGVRVKRNSAARTRLIPGLHLFPFDRRSVGGENSSYPYVSGTLNPQL